MRLHGTNIGLCISATAAMLGDANAVVPRNGVLVAVSLAAFGLIVFGGGGGVLNKRWELGKAVTSCLCGSRMEMFLAGQMYLRTKVII